MRKNRLHFMLLYAAVFMGLAYFVSKKVPLGPAKPEPAQPTAPATPTPVPEPLSKPSWNWDELFSSEKESIPSPQAGLLIEWRVKQGDRLRYRLGQETILERRELNADEGSKEVEQLLEGTLVVDGLERGDVQFQMDLAPMDLIQKGKRIDVKGAKAPSQAFTTSSDGILKRNRYSGDDEATLQLLMDIVFPMTDRTLLEGEEFERVVRSPFAEKESKLVGKVLTTFKGCVMAGGRKCARLETELDMDVVSDPGTEGPQGKWQGKATAFYDLDKRLFIGSTVSMNTVTSRPGEPFKTAQIQRFVAQVQP